MPCKNCKWVGYCGGEYDYICHIKRQIVLNYLKARHPNISLLNNWFIVQGDHTCEWYIKSNKTEEEIIISGRGM